MDSDNSKSTAIKNLLESSQHNKYDEMKKSKILIRDSSDNKFTKIKLKLKVPSLKTFSIEKNNKSNIFKMTPKKVKTRNSVINHYKLKDLDNFSQNNIKNSIEKDEDKLSLPKIFQTNYQNDNITNNELNYSFSDLKYNKFRKTVTFSKNLDKKESKTHKHITLSPSSVMPSPIKVKNSNSNYNNLIDDDNNLSPKEILKKYDNLRSLKLQHKYHKKYIKKTVTFDISKKNSQLEEFSVKNIDLKFPNYPIPKTSIHSINNIIKSFAVNSYQGLSRKYNEDKVSIILTINKPKKYNGDWPKCSLFAIYDGHGGNKCCDFLRDNLHNYIVKNIYFPDNPVEALKSAFLKAETDFINKYINEDERSGSCSLVALIIDNIIYIANCGDSRALISINNGSDYKIINRIHRPSDEEEKERIILNGGSIYESKSIKRIIPGRLSVCRAFGDIYAKFEKFGGKPNVLIAEPDIYKIDINSLNEKIDFLLLGCDGIFDYFSNKDCIKCVWNVVYDENHNYKNIHDFSLNIINMVIKTALRRRTLDNVTAVFVGFQNFKKKFLEEKKSKMTIPSSDEKRENYKLKFNQYKKSRNENIVTHSVQFSHDSELMIKKKVDRTLILSS